jgi:hypothetical protein
VPLKQKFAVGGHMFESRHDLPKVFGIHDRELPTMPAL